MRRQTIRRSRDARGRARLAFVAVTASIALVAAPGPASAESTEIDLTPFLNNVGIQRDPTLMNADFDGGGYAYSGVALQIGDPIDGYPGVEPGDTITAGDFTFTWPDRPAGATDNMLAVGQTIPIPETPGATQLGFLGASTQGASTGTLTLNYVSTDASGNEVHESVPAQVALTDWTRGLAADAPLEANNTVVLKSRFRAWSSSNAAPIFFWTQPHVFLVTVPLDPTKTLESIRFPVAIQIHLFGMAVA